jgi:hypothetical protein
MSLWLWLGAVLVLAFVFEEDPDFGLRLILLGLAALGGWMVLRNGSRLIARGKNPVLSIEPSELLVGQPFTLRYAPPPGRPDELRGVKARLICRERMTPATGRARDANTHDWVVSELYDEPTGGAAGTVELRIPEDAMHTFEARHHSITWRIEVEPRNRRHRSGSPLDLPITVLPAMYEE